MVFNGSSATAPVLRAQTFPVMCARRDPDLPTEAAMPWIRMLQAPAAHLWASCAATSRSNVTSSSLKTKRAHRALGAVARARHCARTRDGGKAMRTCPTGRLWIGAAFGVICATAAAQTTILASVDSSGTPGNHPSMRPSISAGGRYVVFSSLASNLVPGDTNGKYDVFLHDLQTGQTTRVSVNSLGQEGDDDSGGQVNRTTVSADGRYVAFESFATNLVPGDTNGYFDVFVHDVLTGQTQCASVGASGTPSSTGSSGDPVISADGRFVAFGSNADDLAPGTAGPFDKVFVRDLVTGQTLLASVGVGGALPNNVSAYPAISGDGRYIAFASLATNLVLGMPYSQNFNVFVYDQVTQSTVLVSADANGSPGNDYSGAGVGAVAISSDGRYVAFDSSATNLVPNDTNGMTDIFVRDLLTNQLTRVSEGFASVQANGDSFGPSISAGGRFVAFMSDATNLVNGDTNGWVDIFVHDRQTGINTRASVSISGGQADSLSYWPSISDDGRYVAFESSASNFGTGDLGGADAFVRDRGVVPAIDRCLPGMFGVMACPCGNPPSGAPRGCDNSAATGGAILTSIGQASLAQDLVVFTTAEQRPAAPSVLTQGNATIASGAVFGQGVSCVGGTVHRLFTKTAVNGSITAPGPGDPSISMRSIAVGDPIAPGQNRWYAVYYRDPYVLGGCSPLGTFNITQTQEVQWSP
jgi:Tol biopolymer transport system component